MTLSEKIKKDQRDGVLRFSIPNVIERFEEISAKWEDMCRKGYANDKSLLNELANEIIYLIENGTE